MANSEDDLGGLFLESWYRAAYPDVGAAGLDALAHYFQYGSREGRRPNPWFQPEWYRARYPDVEAAGIEPLHHYATYGWREERDPSTAFSTSYYLSQNPDVAASGTQPLLHYLRYGFAEGRRPHPILAGMDLADPRVAVIVDSTVTGEGLPATLAGLSTACARIDANVVIVASGTVSSAANAECENLQFGTSASPAKVVEASPDLGRVGAVVAAMRECDALGATHIFLLTAGDTVSSPVLARLLDLCEPVVCPVAALGDTDQNVPFAPGADASDDLSASTEGVAGLRFAGWTSRPDSALRLGVTGLLIRIDVARAASFLDTQFDTVSAASADLGWRLMADGHRPVVSRNLFIDTPEPLRGASVVSQEALDEERLRRRHPHSFIGRSEAWIASWTQDWRRLQVVESGSPACTFQRRTLNAHFDRCAGIAMDAARAARQLSELVKSDAARPLQGSAFQPNPADNVGNHNLTKAGAPAGYGRLLNIYLSELKNSNALSFANALVWRKSLQDLAPVLFRQNSTVVMCTVDPFEPKCREGYLARVIKVDTVLAPRPRIYVHVVPSSSSSSALVARGENLWVLTLRESDAVGTAFLRTLVKISRVLTHSIFPLRNAVLRAALQGREAFAMIDLHGAVSNELRLYDDPYGSQSAAQLEADVWRTFGQVVCVSRTMAEHFKTMYGSRSVDPLVCPITPAFADYAAGKARLHDHRPRAIYVGGAQRWQQPSQIVETIISTSEWCDHVVLTPDLPEFERLFAAHGCQPDELGMTLETASQAEVYRYLVQSDFGLVLRDNSVVNRVSCPTKLIEYLLCDVIPILDSPAIGDFADMGLAYVPLVDFMRHALPDADERAVMLHRNKQVLASLQKQSKDGLTFMSNWLADAIALNENVS